MPIYLDHNSTTPIDPRVTEAMLPWLQGLVGNPSSAHWFGRKSREAIEQARQQVSELVNVRPEQVVFTSGGTEANNLAIRGLIARNSGAVAVGATEHPSVLRTASATGRELLMLPVNCEGAIDLQRLSEIIGQHSLALVSVMLANNETGVIQDIAAIAGLLKPHSIPLHCDAIQGAGKVSVDMQALGCDLLSLSAHKFHGPKGVGALILDPVLDPEPLLAGGGQEHGLRSGTENVAAIVGFGMAAQLATDELDVRSKMLTELRSRLEQKAGGLAGVEVVAASVPRLPNTTLLVVSGIDGDTLTMVLDQADIAVSSGSACASGSGSASGVLMSMGLDPASAMCSIRVSLGHDNTSADVDAFIEQLESAIRQLQQLGDPETAWSSP